MASTTGPHTHRMPSNCQIARLLQFSFPTEEPNRQYPVRTTQPRERTECRTLAMSSFGSTLSLPQSHRRRRRKDLGRATPVDMDLESIRARRSRLEALTASLRLPPLGPAAGGLPLSRASSLPGTPSAPGSPCSSSGIRSHHDPLPEIGRQRQDSPAPSCSSSSMVLPSSSQGDEFLPKIMSPEVPLAIPEDKEDGSDVTEIQLEDEAKIYDDTEDGEREVEREKEGEGDTKSIQGKISYDNLEAVRDAASNPGCSLGAASEDVKDIHFEDAYSDDENDFDIHETVLNEMERSPSSRSRKDVDFP
ncbi:uncharacterized protein LOC125029986 [Penaeus chinensis]|uniref:uncharacterized protein LOC125029986 n=1 Tax=Penaeus chinensis TaxID=139456 RepID=UPI001FB6E16C|nr:uncharacterized protein LOC125029986 [Penaeus chinensis]